MKQGNIFFIIKAHFNMKHSVIGLYNMLIRVKVSTKEGVGDCNPGSDGPVGYRVAVLIGLCNMVIGWTCQKSVTPANTAICTFFSMQPAAALSMHNRYRLKSHFRTDWNLKIFTI